MEKFFERSQNLNGQSVVLFPPNRAPESLGPTLPIATGLAFNGTILCDCRACQQNGFPSFKPEGWAAHVSSSLSLPPYPPAAVGASIFLPTLGESLQEIYDRCVRRSQRSRAGQRGGGDAAASNAAPAAAAAAAAAAAGGPGSGPGAGLRAPTPPGAGYSGAPQPPLASQAQAWAPGVASASQTGGLGPAGPRYQMPSSSEFLLSLFSPPPAARGGFSLPTGAAATPADQGNPTPVMLPAMYDSASMISPLVLFGPGSGGGSGPGSQTPASGGGTDGQGGNGQGNGFPWSQALTPSFFPLPLHMLLPPMMGGQLTPLPPAHQKVGGQGAAGKEERGSERPAEETAATVKPAAAAAASSGPAVCDRARPAEAREAEAPAAPAIDPPTAAAAVERPGPSEPGPEPGSPPAIRGMSRRGPEPTPTRPIRMALLDPFSPATARVAGVVALAAPGQTPQALPAPPRRARDVRPPTRESSPGLGGHTGAPLAAQGAAGAGQDAPLDPFDPPAPCGAEAEARPEEPAERAQAQAPHGLGGSSGAVHGMTSHVLQVNESASKGPKGASESEWQETPLEESNAPAASAEPSPNHANAANPEPGPSSLEPPVTTVSNRLTTDTTTKGGHGGASGLFCTTLEGEGCDAGGAGGAKSAGLGITVVGSGGGGLGQAAGVGTGGGGGLDEATSPPQVQRAQPVSVTVPDPAAAGAAPEDAPGARAQSTEDIRTGAGKREAPGSDQEAEAQMARPVAKRPRIDPVLRELAQLAQVAGAEDSRRRAAAAAGQQAPVSLASAVVAAAPTAPACPASRAPTPAPGAPAAATVSGTSAPSAGLHALPGAGTGTGMPPPHARALTDSAQVFVDASGPDSHVRPASVPVLPLAPSPLGLGPFGGLAAAAAALSASAAAGPNGDQASANLGIGVSGPFDQARWVTQAQTEGGAAQISPLGPYPTGLFGLVGPASGPAAGSGLSGEVGGQATMAAAPAQAFPGQANAPGYPQVGFPVGLVGGGQVFVAWPGALGFGNPAAGNPFFGGFGLGGGAPAPRQAAMEALRRIYGQDSHSHGAGGAGGAAASAAAGGAWTGTGRSGSMGREPLPALYPLPDLPMTRKGGQANKSTVGARGASGSGGRATGEKRKRGSPAAGGMEHDEPEPDASPAGPATTSTPLLGGMVSASAEDPGRSRTRARTRARSGITGSGARASAVAAAAAAPAAAASAAAAAAAAVSPEVAGRGEGPKRPARAVRPARARSGSDAPASRSATPGAAAAAAAAAAAGGGLSNGGSRGASGAASDRPPARDGSARGKEAGPGLEATAVDLDLASLPLSVPDAVSDAWNKWKGRRDKGNLGLYGVTKNKRRYQARLLGKTLGCTFDTPEAASEAYDRAAAMMFGAEGAVEWGVNDEARVRGWGAAAREAQGGQGQQAAEAAEAAEGAEGARE